jgi:hypothetical protein
MIWARSASACSGRRKCGQEFGASRGTALYSLTCREGVFSELRPSFPGCPILLAALRRRRSSPASAVRCSLARTPPRPPAAGYRLLPIARLYSMAHRVSSSARVRCSRAVPPPLANKRAYNPRSPSAPRRRYASRRLACAAVGFEGPQDAFQGVLGPRPLVVTEGALGVRDRIRAASQRHRKLAPRKANSLAIFGY